MDTQDILDDTRLRYSSPDAQGYGRKRHGSGFTYYDDGKKITDAAIIERIEKLAIPPALTQVWICKYANGHLQATGMDSKGRKQYFYHEQWVKVSQLHKFDHLLQFAQTLPKIRARLKSDMSMTNLSKQKILATIVWLLENTLIRVGNKEYEKENKSYGLTTLKSRHATVRKDTISFQFKGKSGVYHDVDIKSRRVAKIIKECQELPGQQLFEYIDEQGKRQNVTSEDINNYLKEITGEEITAKDFRTWAGTLIAAELCDRVGLCTEEKELKKNIVGIVKKVASHLRNKPSTCRKYYIHPAVFISYTKGYILSNIESYKNYKRPHTVGELTKTENTIFGILSSFGASLTPAV